MGWRVGVWLSDPENVKGLRKLRPRVELHSPQREKPRGLATEQKRHVHADLAMTHAYCRVCCMEDVETAVLQVERANGRQ